MQAGPLRAVFGGILQGAGKDRGDGIEKDLHRCLPGRGGQGQFRPLRLDQIIHGVSGAQA